MPTNYLFNYIIDVMKMAYYKRPVKVVLDKNDYILNENEEIEIPINTPHRLCGLENYGLVAEIWIHTNPQHPSDENDIVRLEDDFNRLN